MSGGGGRVGGHVDRSRSWANLVSPTRITLVVVGLVMVAVAVKAPWRDPQAAVTSPVGPTTVASPVPVGGSLGALDPIYSAASSQLNALLSARGSAVVSSSQSKLLAESGTHPDAALRRMADNLARLRVSEWTYGKPSFNEALTTTARASTPRAIVLDVDVATRLRFDTHAAVVPEHVTFVPNAAGKSWHVAAESAVGPAVPIWQAATLTVVRGQRSLVVGVGTSANLTDIAQRSDSAVAHVTSVWGNDWARGVVVIVPDSTAMLSKLLGGATRKEFAAVTTASVPGLGVADRVWMVPGDWGKLDAKGRTVILRHEFTHVATQAAAPTNHAPLWLAEGFADYVGYGGLGIAEDVIAQELRTAVRGGSQPTSLPTNSDFQQQGGNALSSDYEEGWLACVTIADSYGQDALVSFYRVAASQGTDAAFAQTLHTTQAAFTRSWESQIHGLAA